MAHNISNLGETLAHPPEDVGLAAGSSSRALHFLILFFHIKCLQYLFRLGNALCTWQMKTDEKPATLKS